MPPYIHCCSAINQLEQKLPGLNFFVLYSSLVLPIRCLCSPSPISHSYAFARLLLRALGGYRNAPMVEKSPQNIIDGDPLHTGCGFPFPARLPTQH